MADLPGAMSLGALGFVLTMAMSVISFQQAQTKYRETQIFVSFEDRCPRPTKTWLTCSHGSVGIDDKSICCDSSCTKCGGSDCCATYAGTRSKCRELAIREAGSFCDSSPDVACILYRRRRSLSLPAPMDMDAILVLFPLQLFAFASDPILLQNDESHKCMSRDLDLASCVAHRCCEVDICI